MDRVNSLKNRILKYFEVCPNKWVNGGVIEKLAMSVGYKASNASRRCRELVNEGNLERKIDQGSVWYRFFKKPIQEKMFDYVK
ncbi:hypothetical protein ISS21_01705 [Patescibacteria group bacterium]|nr:hypothetical protein [Patescibacteria group bacterium]